MNISCVDLEIAAHYDMNLRRHDSYTIYQYKDNSLRALVTDNKIDIPAPDSELADIAASILLDKPQIIGVTYGIEPLPIGPLHQLLYVWIDLLR